MATPGSVDVCLVIRRSTGDSCNPTRISARLCGSWASPGTSGPLTRGYAESVVRIMNLIRTIWCKAPWT